MKRLPAYGRSVAKQPIDLRDVFVTCHWDLGKGRRRIVVPEDTEPRNLNLAFLRGRSVILLHRSDDDATRMIALVQAILEAGAMRLIALDVDAGAACFLRVATPEERAAA